MIARRAELSTATEARRLSRKGCVFTHARKQLNRRREPRRGTHRSLSSLAAARLVGDAVALAAATAASFTALAFFSVFFSTLVAVATPFFTASPSAPRAPPRLLVSRLAPGPSSAAAPLMPTLLPAAFLLGGVLSRVASGRLGTAGSGSSVSTEASAASAAAVAKGVACGAPVDASPSLQGSASSRVRHCRDIYWPVCTAQRIGRGNSTHGTFAEDRSE